MASLVAKKVSLPDWPDVSEWVRSTSSVSAGGLDFSADYDDSSAYRAGVVEETKTTGWYATKKGIETIKIEIALGGVVTVLGIKTTSSRVTLSSEVCGSRIHTNNKYKEHDESTALLIKFRVTGKRKKIIDIQTCPRDMPVKLIISLKDIIADTPVGRTFSSLLIDAECDGRLAFTKHIHYVLNEIHKAIHYIVSRDDDDIIHTGCISTDLIDIVTAYDVLDIINVQFPGHAKIDFILSDEKETDDMPVKAKEISEAPPPMYMDNWVGGVWIPDDALPLITALKEAESLDPINIMLTGGSGYGKTTICEVIAETLGFKFIRINCATVLDTESWFGYQEARGGDTVFVSTEFTEAVVQGGAVILLDEINRIEPWISNSLFPILDYARETTVHGEHIEVGPNVIFMMTMNLGVEFAGTFVTDAAMTNRIDATLEVGQPPVKVENEIVEKRYPVVDKLIVKKVVSVIRSLRDDAEFQEVNTSTRTVLKVARLISIGIDPRNALVYGLVNSAEQTKRKEILDAINSKFSLTY